MEQVETVVINYIDANARLADSLVEVPVTKITRHEDPTLPLKGFHNWYVEQGRIDIAGWTNVIVTRSTDGYYATTWQSEMVPGFRPVE